LRELILISNPFVSSIEEEESLANLRDKKSVAQDLLNKKITCDFSSWDSDSTENKMYEKPSSANMSRSDSIDLTMQYVGDSAYLYSKVLVGGYSNQFALPDIGANLYQEIINI